MQQARGGAQEGAGGRGRGRGRGMGGGGRGGNTIAILVQKEQNTSKSLRQTTTSIYEKLKEIFPTIEEFDKSIKSIRIGILRGWRIDKGEAMNESFEYLKGIIGKKPGRRSRRDEIAYDDYQSARRNIQQTLRRVRKLYFHSVSDISSLSDLSASDKLNRQENFKRKVNEPNRSLVPHEIPALLEHELHGDNEEDDAGLCSSEVEMEEEDDDCPDAVDDFSSSVSCKSAESVM
jgi:hypothetical protein